MSLDLSSSFPHFKIPMSERSKNGTYAFDQFKLDAGKLMLYRDGVSLSLPPKVVKTLTVLVENQDSIISKDDLIRQVWDDSVVEESNLSQHLYLLRKTLGNKPDGEPYIETLRRRGYRFTGYAESVEDKREPPPKRSERESAPAAVTVERHGNVLRLVDWQPAELALPHQAASLPDEPVTRSLLLRLALAGGIVFVAAASLIIYWFWPSAQASDTPATPELTVVRLTNGVAPVNATITEDGDYFVYDESDGEGSTLWLQQVGQSNRVEIGRSVDKWYSAKTFSHDGRFVYYTAIEKATNHSALYRVPSMGGPLTKLIDTVVGAVSFSPNGEEIVFMRDKEGVASHLVVADKDGRNEKVILEVAYPKRIVGPPDWAPNGDLIAFAQSDLSNGTLEGTVAFFGVNPNNGERLQLSTERWDTAYRIEWLPDGAGFVTIATREGEGRTPWRDQVFYISYPGGSSRRMTNDGNRHHVWGLGVTKSDEVIATPFGRSSQIWSLDISDPGSALQISTGVVDGRAGLAPLPDGRIGYIAQTGGQLNAWIMNPDGSGATQLTSEPAIVEELRADPQGRYFVFVGETRSGSHLFRLDVNGTNTRQLTFGEGNNGDSTISPDGQWIIYSTLVLEAGPGRTELRKVAIDGGEPSRFSDELCASPVFSPDGSMVSCIRDEREILVLSAADGKKLESYTLPTNAIVNFGALWVPDGSGLTFIRSEKNSSNIWRQPRNKEPPDRVTSFTSGYITRHAYAPDGKRLLISRGYPQGGAVLIKGFR